MRIAIAQMRTRAGDFEETARRMVDYARRAAGQGCDLLIFPMNVLCGPSAVQVAEREGFMADLAECVTGLVDDLACPCLIPVLTEFGDVAVPEALLVSEGEVTPVSLAARLGSLAADPTESPDASLPELEFAGARLGVAFTYDDLDVYDEYDYNVDVIVFLSGYGFAVDDPSSALGPSLTEGRFLADAETTGAWIVGVGSLGCYDLQVFCGASFVLAPWGELAAQAPSLEEALLICDVDPSAEGPLTDPLTPEVYDAPLMAWGALTMGLADACEQAGAEGACLMLDGSLSSALVAALATDALGPERVYVLIDTDEEGTAVSDLVRALRLAPDHVERVELGSGGDRLLARDLAQAHLAALARRTRCLALGSLDKTGRALEEPLGTSAASLNPLGDLYRSDVISLAHLRNTISPVIPPSLLGRFEVPDVEGLPEAFAAPEARLGFVDLVLSSLVEWELTPSQVVSERGHEELVEHVIALLRDRQNRLAPLGARSLVVSSKTLEEARSPMGLAWVDRVRGEAPSPKASARPAAPEPTASQGAPLGRAHESEVRDLLGYLRDFSAGGAFSPMGGSPSAPGREDGRGGGDAPHSLWEGPFSEN